MFASDLSSCTVRYVPAWFPGAEFKRYAKRVGAKMAEMEHVPFNWAKKQIVCLFPPFELHLIHINIDEWKLYRIICVKASPL